MRLWHLLTLSSLAGPLLSQANTIPGLGSRLSDVSGLASFGRQGTFPTGRNGLAVGVSVCNNGSVIINWLAAMNPDHPFYAFMLCRESNGRFSQISDRSFCKHGFASINFDCPSCIFPPQGGAALGIGCGDTYGAALNANQGGLGPPEEIDPWLLNWVPVGSYFDRGDPDVGPPGNRDGVVSPIFITDPIEHLIQVDDVDLNTAGATFFVGGRVMTRGEAEATREDNLQSRRYTAAWNGSQWVFSNPGAMVAGTPLNQWTGATLRSNTNGGADGRVWIGAKVAQLPNGLWHYEYALHNRDNSRGIAGVHLPKCPTARILNAGFRDIDRNVLDDWTIAVGASEVAALAAAGNPLEWNTIYNVWFDSDAAPAGGTATLDEARLGAGALQFTVLDVPAPLTLRNEFLGQGCGSPVPSLRTTGTPAVANVPNASFGAQIDGHAGTVVWLVTAAAAVSLPLGNGCTQYVDTASAVIMGFAVTNAAGSASYALAVPNLPVFEGLDVILQGAETAAGGPALGLFNLTNGLRVRVGNARTGCP